MELIIRLNQQQWEYVLSVLGQRPYTEVFELLTIMQSQARQQLGANRVEQQQSE